MPDLINFITQGVNEFTPATVCGLMVFSMIFEGLFMEGLRQRDLRQG